MTIQEFAALIERGYTEHPELGQARDFYEDREDDKLVGMCPILSSAVATGFSVSAFPGRWDIYDHLKRQGVDMVNRRYMYEGENTPLEDIIFDLNDKKQLAWPEIVKVIQGLQTKEKKS